MWIPKYVTNHYETSTQFDHLIVSISKNKKLFIKNMENDHLIFSCYFIFQSVNLYAAACQCEWTYWNGQNRRTLLTIMINTSKEMKFTSFGIVDLGHEIIVRVSSKLWQRKLYFSYRFSKNILIFSIYPSWGWINFKISLYERSLS